MKPTTLSDVIRHLELLKAKYGDMKVKSAEIEYPSEDGWAVNVPGVIEDPT